MKSIGGQAVIEGVMMKSEKGWSVAVRDPQGNIQVKQERLKPLPTAFKLPVLRGFVALFHALVIGIKALEYSATLAGDSPEDKPLSKTAIALTLAFSMVLGLGLFLLFPLYATKLTGLLWAAVNTSSIAFNLVDGLYRVAVFLAYVWAIGMWSEIQRVFQYHGAEHKVIHAFEEGRHNTEPANIIQYSPLHPRCGTSFLLIVMVISIIVFAFVPQHWPLAWKFGSRLVLIPLVAGLSYETLKFSAKMKDNPLVRAMIWPGLALQRLTTREPDEAQVEVAQRALSSVLELEPNEA